LSDAAAVAPSARAPRRGRRLRAGDVVAIAAPSGPVAPHELHLAGEALRARGFVALQRHGVAERQGHLAGGDWRRAGELNALLGDLSVRAVWCARGGFGAARLLDALDFGAVRADPRPLVGFSDATALLCGLWAAARLCTVHGPLAAGAPHMTPRTAAALWRLLCDPAPPGRLDAPGELRALRAGRAEGPLVGGNLATLAALCGTPFFPPLDGAVLFLEEDPGDSLIVIDRALTQLRLSGALAGVAGVVLGAWPRDPAAEALVVEALGARAVPVVTGFPAGHGTENVPLPMGATVRLDRESLTALDGVVVED